MPVIVALMVSTIGCLAPELEDESNEFSAAGCTFVKVSEGLNVYECLEDGKTCHYQVDEDNQVYDWECEWACTTDPSGTCREYSR